MHKVYNYFMYSLVLNTHAFYIGQKDSNIICKDNESLLIMNMDITPLENVILLVKGLIFLSMFFIFSKSLHFGTVIKKHILKCVWHRTLSFYLKFIINKLSIFP